MDALDIFATIGSLINDLLAILSVIGSVILFFGAFSKVRLRWYGKVAYWSVGGLVFGVFFQLSMAINGSTPEQIGFVVRMTPLMVNGLLGLSLILLVGRWLIRRRRSYS